MRIVHVSLLLPFLMLGCGSSSPLQPASGRLLFKDKTPVKGAIIELVAEDGTTARGRSDDLGRFELATGGKPGAKPGSYRVAIIHMVVTDGIAKHSSGQHARHVIHPKYAKPESSRLTFTVSEGPNDINFDLDNAAR